MTEKWLMTDADVDAGVNAYPVVNDEHVTSTLWNIKEAKLTFWELSDQINIFEEEQKKLKSRWS